MNPARGRSLGDSSSSGIGRDGCLLDLRRSAERNSGLFVAASIVAIAIAGFVLPNGPLPRLAIITPIAYFVAVLGDAGTALVLFATWPLADARRSMVVLTLAFAVNAALLFLAMLALPLLPDSPPVFSVRPQAAVWMFEFWHVCAAAGALIYVLVRRNESQTAPSRRFVIIAAGVALTVVFGLVVGLLFAGTGLPAMVGVGSSLAPMVANGSGPFAVVLLALATVAIFLLRAPAAIDRALALSLLALTLSMVILLGGSHRYNASFYAGRILVLIGGLWVLVTAVRTLVLARTRLGLVEGALSQAVGESAKRAGRIRAVWEIAAKAEFSDADRFEAMLALATAALRPGMPMHGLLTHLEEETLVIDAAVRIDGDAGNVAFELDAAGAALPLDRTLHRLLVDADRALAWNDLRPFRAQGMHFEELGWQSFIGVRVTIARKTYFVSFASCASLVLEPFVEEDLAYVDVVSAFFANRYAQEQQFERIQFQIEHDALTGLENRVQFRKAVRAEIAKKQPFAIAFVDVDGFRLINEREGHQIGDEVLVEVASGLTSVNANNLVARMSADEFGLLIRSSKAPALDATLDRYSDVFRAPFHTGDRNGTQMLGIGASIGAARFPEHGKSGEDLMRRADVALTVAKSRGGSTTLQFEPPMEAILEETHLRVVELQTAIAEDRLALVYQPTFDLQTRKIIGAEALVRWDHPERGRLLPGEFVGFAERNGLSGPLSAWVLRQLVRDITSAALPPGVRLYFNLSAQMLDDIPFIAGLDETLRATPQLVEHLGVEVTETAAMQNVERSMHTIDLFRRWGLTVAIDDFGTGYSSLAYLKQLTVDVIKLDRSFVTGLPYDERDCALADMLLQITQRFGFATLAEGIETEAQAQWLLEHGCRFGQGYLVSKPHSFDVLLQRLGVLHAA